MLYYRWAMICEISPSVRLTFASFPEPGGSERGVYQVYELNCRFITHGGAGLVPPPPFPVRARRKFGIQLKILARNCAAVFATPPSTLYLSRFN